MRKRSFLKAFFFLLILIAGAGLYVRHMIFGENVPLSIPEDSSINIASGATSDTVFYQLKEGGFLKNSNSFKWVAKLMKYEGDIPTGKYKIIPGSSNRELINMLRTGRQVPVHLTINNIRTVTDLSGKLASYVETDSVSIAHYLSDTTVLTELGYTKEDIITLFIPNTYEVYWNTSPEKLVARFRKEHDAFWEKENRKEKIAQRGLTEREAYTLASIVSKESNHAPEMPRLAGVYMNRLDTGMKLQADPTVVFGVGDFSIRRVLNRHIAHDSPYNTYIYEGLPPGPICMPSIESLDAVINAEKHDYFFFCAKPGFGSQHAFAKTLRQHNRNASNYRKWLNENSIR